VTTPQQQEIDRWLDTATRGLSRKTARLARQELYTHYLDAFDTYRDEGKSSDEAHHTALADLGDPRVTGTGMRDTHNAERRYWIAAAASLAYPILVMLELAGQMPYNVQGALVYNGVILVTVLIMMDAMRTLLATRCNLNVRWRTYAVSAGVSIVALTSIAVYAINPLYATCFGATAVPLAEVFNASWLTGAVLLGISLVWLGEAVLRVRPSSIFFRPMCIFAILNGYLIAAHGATFGLGMCNAASVLLLAFFFCNSIHHLMWTAVFYFAARRESRSPLQAA